jgi:hypothetical protein
MHYTYQFPHFKLSTPLYSDEEISQILARSSFPVEWMRFEEEV